MTKKVTTKLHMQRGYTLLFAVLVSSLVLAIGISILNINKKEFLLTAGGRDSSAAFYAADGGLECAVFADEQGIFATDDDHTFDLQSTCNISTDSPITVTNITLNDPEGTFVFEAKLGSEGASCAIVTVSKTLREDGSIRTTIDSKGYNTGWNQGDGLCNLPSAKRVERGIRYSF